MRCLQLYCIIHTLCNYNLPAACTVWNDILYCSEIISYLQHALCWNYTPCSIHCVEIISYLQQALCWRCLLPALSVYLHNILPLSYNCVKLYSTNNMYCVKIISYIHDAILCYIEIISLPSVWFSPTVQGTVGQIVNYFVCLFDCLLALPSSPIGQVSQ